MYTMLSRALLGLAFSQYAFANPEGHEKRQSVDCPVSPTTVSDCTYFVCSQQGDTCASLASYWGITTAEFIDYNPVVGSSCQNFTVNEGYCVEENYGRGPATSTTTSTTTSTGTSKTTTTTTTGSPAPSPTQSGLISSCTRFYKVQSGDTCAGIVDMYQEFTLGQFYQWNPAVGSSCSYLETNVYVCTAVPGTPSSPIPVKASSTTVTGSYPRQSGIATNCNKYYDVKSGDTCQGIATQFSITLTQFYTWNPAVKSDCSELIAGDYVCVSVTGLTTTKTPTSTKTSTNTGPSPTQSGIVSNCDKFYKAVSGDTCAAIAAKYCTFTTAQFISWNPAVGSGCTSLLAGDYYCVGVPTTPTKCLTTSTKPTSTPTNGPQPQQPGIVSNCNKFYDVVSGDSCYSIEQKYGITSTQFFDWNTGINTSCGNLYAGYYVCVGIS